MGRTVCWFLESKWLFVTCFTFRYICISDMFQITPFPFSYKSITDVAYGTARKFTLKLFDIKEWIQKTLYNFPLILLMGVQSKALYTFYISEIWITCWNFDHVIMYCCLTLTVVLSERWTTMTRYVAAILWMETKDMAQLYFLTAKLWAVVLRLKR